MNKKWLLGLILVFSVSLLAACSGDNSEGQDTQNEEATEGSAGNEQSNDQNNGQSQTAVEPDVDNVPDVVAQVNGEEISKEEFVSTYEGQLSQAAQQSQMSGQEVDQDQLKQQVVEGMVSQELLTQEVDSREFDNLEKEMDKTFDKLAKQYQFESKDEFIAALEEQGMSEEEVKSQVETQTKVNQVVKDEYGEMEPSEEELKEAYEQMKAQKEQMGGDSKMPSFEEAKSDIKAQVKNRKVSEATQKFVQKLREEADVTINL